MLDLLVVLATLQAMPQARPPCDTACEEAIRAAFHWVADFRHLPFSDVVLEVRDRRGTLGTAAYESVRDDVARQLGIRVARAPAVRCESPEALDLSSLPRAWWENRCRITSGRRLLVSMANPPTVAGDSADVSIWHSLYQPAGPGYSHRLIIRRTPDGWQVTASSITAIGSPVIPPRF